MCLEEFHKWVRSKDGHRSICKTCRALSRPAEYQKDKPRIKAHRKANFDRLAARNAAYYLEHKDERLAYLSEWKRKAIEANPDFYKDQYHERKEVISEQRKVARVFDDVTAINERKRNRRGNKKYKEKFPEKVKQYGGSYRQNNREKRNANRRKAMENPMYALGIRLRGRMTKAVKREYRSGSAVRDLGCTIEFFKRYIESQFEPGMTWDNWGRQKGHWQIDHIMPLSAFNLFDRQHVVLACCYLNLQPLWMEENSSKSNKIPTYCLVA